MDKDSPYPHFNGEQWRQPKAQQAEIMPRNKPAPSITTKSRQASCAD